MSLCSFVPLGRQPVYAWVKMLTGKLQGWSRADHLTSPGVSPIIKVRSRPICFLSLDSLEMATQCTARLSSAGQLWEKVLHCPGSSFILILACPCFFTPTLYPRQSHLAQSCLAFPVLTLDLCSKCHFPRYPMESILSPFNHSPFIFLISKGSIPLQPTTSSPMHLDLVSFHLDVSPLRGRTLTVLTFP